MGDPTCETQCTSPPPKSDFKCIFIMTDMEGVAGIDQWEQCYAERDDDPAYRYGLEQLTADTNAAIAGAFGGGAQRVYVLDGHGRNNNKGLLEGVLDQRATRVKIAQHPTRFEGLDENVDGVMVIGQHAMAGTLNGFLDHTQAPKQLCRYQVNGAECGELGQLAIYSGAFGVPVIYASGDEALCDEALALLPGIVTTPTKQGVGWAHCKLYDTTVVRKQISTDVARAMGESTVAPLHLEPPLEVRTEWAWSEWADLFAQVSGVERLDARTVQWRLDDVRDIYTWPSPAGPR